MGVYLTLMLTVCIGHQEGRSDLSHPVHVDNCILEPETRQCWREPPAFIHRDLRCIENGRLLSVTSVMITRQCIKTFPSNKQQIFIAFNSVREIVWVFVNALSVF